MGKLKFKIKNHRITTKTEFLDPTHKLFGKKNLLHPNFYLLNITGRPLRFRPFHAKLSYYLLQPLLKLKIYYSHF
jgi:hypothetical protein